MNSWKVILATIVIFGAGVITGGFLVDHVKQPFHRLPGTGLARPVATDWKDVPAPLRPEMFTKQFVQRLGDELDLTPDQRQKIEKIVTHGQENTHNLWKLVAPQFQIVWHDTRQQIRDVLTPEQKKQFEVLMKQQRQLRRAPATNAPPVLPPSLTNAPAI